MAKKRPNYHIRVAHSATVVVALSRSGSLFDDHSDSILCFFGPGGSLFNDQRECVIDVGREIVDCVVTAPIANIDKAYSISSRSY